MELDKLKGMSDISDDILKELKINSISIISGSGLRPRMIIKYEDKSIDTIDDIDEMEKFIQKLQR